MVDGGTTAVTAANAWPAVDPGQASVHHALTCLREEARRLMHQTLVVASDGSLNRDQRRRAATQTEREIAETLRAIEWLETARP